MNKEKHLTHVRVRLKERDMLKDLSREISYIQKENVSTPEVLRRVFNINDIKLILLKDAQIKRERKYVK